MLQNLLSSPVDGCSIYLKTSTNAVIVSAVRIAEYLNLEAGTDTNDSGRKHIGRVCDSLVWDVRVRQFE